MTKAKRTAPPPTPPAPTLPSWISQQGSDTILEIAVVPRASASRIVGIHDDRLKVQLSAPPVDGAANEALVELLAKSLGVKRSSISIDRGDTGRKKAIRIRATDAALVQAALDPSK